MKTTYSKEFHAQALAKVYNRGNRTIESVATELNMSYHTLKNWMKEKKGSDGKSGKGLVRRPSEWSSAQRLQALLDTAHLSEEERHSWCRSQGLYPHHLQSWREAIERGEVNVSEERRQRRELQEKNRRLERELKRKDKALAEAAALLVLQKKYQALWEDEAD